MKREELISAINTTSWEYYLELSYSTKFGGQDCGILMDKFFEVIRPYRSTMLWIALPTADNEDVYTIRVLLKVEKQVMALMVKGFQYFKDVWLNISESSNGTAMVEKFDNAKITADYLIKDIGRKDSAYCLLK